MKYFRFVFYCFADIFKKQWKIILIIICSIMVTTAIALSLCAQLASQVALGKDRDMLKRTYSIFLNSAYYTSLRVLTEVLDEPTAPPIEDFPVYLGIAGYVADTSQEPYLIEADGSLSYETQQVFSGYPIPDAASCQKWAWYLPEYELSEGRWFSEEELVNGEMVMIPSESYIKETAPNAGVGDTLSVAGFDFTIIGISKSDDPVLTKRRVACNYIPYRAALKHTEKEAGFDFLSSNLNIRYQALLSDETKQAICQTISDQYPNGLTYLPTAPESLYEDLKSGYLNNEIIIFSIIGVLLAICCFNLHSLFRYLLQRNLYQYMIYKVCGIRAKNLAFMIYLCFAAITILSSGLGILLHFAIEPLERYVYLTKPAPAFLYPIILFALLAVMLLSITDLVLKVLKRQPIDRSLWRQ